MVVDARHDHSFRIPRPDLSVTSERRTPATTAIATSPPPGRPPRSSAGTVRNARGSRLTPAPLPRRIRRPPRHGTGSSPSQTMARRPRLPARRRSSFRRPAFRRGRSRDREGARPGPACSDRGAPWPFGIAPRATLAAGERAFVRSSPGRPHRSSLVLADQRTAELSPADRERLDRAADEYLSAQRLNADRAESRSNVAGFLARRGRPAEAEAEYAAALKLQPTMTAIHVNLADLYRRQGREGDAEQLLRSAVSLTPEAGAIRYSLGLSLIRQRRYPEALDELRRAGEFAPEQARSHTFMRWRCNRPAGPVRPDRYSRRPSIRHPSDVDVLTLLLQRALQEKDPARALPYAERLRILRPDDPVIRHSLASSRAEPPLTPQRQPAGQPFPS